MAAVVVEFVVCAAEGGGTLVHAVRCEVLPVDPRLVGRHVLHVGLVLQDLQHQRKQIFVLEFGQPFKEIRKRIFLSKQHYDVVFGGVGRFEGDSGCGAVGERAPRRCSCPLQAQQH